MHCLDRETIPDQVVYIYLNPEDEKAVLQSQSWPASARQAEDMLRTHDRPQQTPALESMVEQIESS